MVDVLKSQTTRNCETCQYVSVAAEETDVETLARYILTSGDRQGELPEWTTSMECRRHPPVAGRGFPKVFEGDWCGEYILKR